MKIKIDKTLLKYSLYIIFIATVLYILYAVVGNIGAILDTIFSSLKRILSILSPFIIALLITYLLHPMVRWLEANLLGKTKLSVKNKRTLSVLLTYIVIVGVLIILLYSIYAMIGGQISSNLNFNGMFDSIIKYTERYNELFQSIMSNLETSGLSEDVKLQFTNLLERTKGFVGTAVGGIFNWIGRLGSNLVNIVLAIIIAFYLLKDIDYFKRLSNEVLDVILKPKYSKKTKLFFGDIDNVVSKFIRGQLLDGLIVGVITSFGLWAIGLDFPVLIGMTAGISNVIPYFGPIIGSIPAVIVGLLSGTPIKALFAVLVLVLVQQLDGAVISPKVVGESVGLHPVFIILSITIGGAYFGLLGMLVAVPIAGIIKLIVLRWRHGNVNDIEK